MGIWVIVSQTVCLRKLLLEHCSLGLIGWVRGDIFGPEVIQELIRNFVKSLFSEQHGIVLEFAEWNELHDISVHIPLVLVREERGFISIKLVHGTEVSIADTHNDNGERVARATDNLVNSSLHVIDNTVSNDKQNVILLILLGHIHRLSHVVH